MLFYLLLLGIALRLLLKYATKVNKARSNATAFSQMSEMERLRREKLRNMGRTNVVNQKERSHKIDTRDAEDVDYIEIKK